MSHTLAFDFVIESERGPIYWWPLIFEAMGWHSFFFSAPDQPKGFGYSYSVHGGEPLAQEPFSFNPSPFKAVWDEIYSERREVLISFWSTTMTHFNVDVSIVQSKEDPLVHLCLYLDGAELMALSDDEAKEHLRVVFDCVKSLYQLCQPCTGEAYWEFVGDRYAPWVLFGKLPQDISSHRFSLMNEGKWVVQTLPNGNQINLFDPVPIRPKWKR